MSAEDSKTAGNAAFKAKNYDEAIKCFSEAIKLESENEAFYSNRSAAYAKNNQLDEAIADAEKCIALKKDWVKGYSRKGAALTLKGDFTAAIEAYTAGLAFDADNKDLNKGLEAAKNAAAGGDKKKKKRKKKKGKKEAPADGTEAAKEDYVIGIDLGTTYSCVAVWKNDDVTIIENKNGQKTIPSYVSFDSATGQRYTGSAAKNQITRNPRNTIYDVKRFIGQRYNDAGVKADIDRLHYDVTAGDDGQPLIGVDVKGERKLMQPEEISAMVLGTCKELAEEFLGQEVKRAVVTVPAYFNDAQRTATKLAGRIAGLDVLRIINEPTAAALSYGLDNAIKKDKALNTLIFDLGGGTFDVSILTIEDGVFTVKATGGDTRLGGEDFDNNLVQHLAFEVERQGIPDPRDDPRAMQRLRKAAEGAKRELSQSQSTEVRLDALNGNTNFHAKVTRAKFEDLNKGPFNTCLDTVKRVLKDAKLKESDIDEIVLVGGSTRIPKLQAMLSEHFGGKALCKTLNPDEAVAYGAAVQGAILNGKRNSKTDSLLLMDVTPLSLGIETTGRVMSVIIPRNTPIPVTKTQTFTTEYNYATEETCSVYEGERVSTTENNMLAEFKITGIEVAKKGEPQINVTFAIDSNGILKVTAKDAKTGASNDIEIANRSACTTEEIDRMVAEAAKHKAEDEERLRKVEAKNGMEQAIFDATETAEKIEDKKLKAILEKAAAAEQEWLDANWETAKASAINLRRRALQQRLDGKKK